MRKIALASTALLGLGILASAPAEARGWGYGGGYGHGGYGGGYRGIGFRGGYGGYRGYGYRGYGYRRGIGPAPPSASGSRVSPPVPSSRTRTAATDTATVVRSGTTADMVTHRPTGTRRPTGMAIRLTATDTEASPT